VWSGRAGGIGAGRLRLAAGLALGAAGLAAAFFVRAGLGGFTVLDGARRAAARFGGVVRLAAFLGVFARFAVARAGLAAARPFRVFRPVFLDAAPATRRFVPPEEEELRFGRLVRPPVGRFLAMSV
jgi:hypothetical protein